MVIIELGNNKDSGKDSEKLPDVYIFNVQLT